MSAQASLSVVRGDVLEDPPRSNAILALRQRYPIMDIYTKIRVTSAARILDTLEALNVKFTLDTVGDGTENRPKTTYRCIANGTTCLEFYELSVLPSRVIYCRGELSTAIVDKMRRESPAKLFELYTAVAVPNMCNMIGNHFLCLGCYCKIDGSTKICADCASYFEKEKKLVLAKAPAILYLFPKDISWEILGFIWLIC